MRVPRFQRETPWDLGDCGGHPVPDTGSTLSLMTLTLMALGLVARRSQRAAAYRAKVSRSRLFFRY